MPAEMFWRADMPANDIWVRVAGEPIEVCGESINVKLVPSKLYANCWETPGDVAKLEVPANRASIEVNDSAFPGVAESVIWK